jgi:hypothetical protein
VAFEAVKAEIDLLLMEIAQTRRHPRFETCMRGIPVSRCASRSRAASPLHTMKCRSFRSPPQKSKVLSPISTAWERARRRDQPQRNSMRINCDFEGRQIARR